MTKPTKQRALLERVYLAGFLASSEGYNGEYPFSDNNETPTGDTSWVSDRDNYLNALEEIG